jgi:hypothetical protein
MRTQSRQLAPLTAVTSLLIVPTPAAIQQDDSWRVDSASLCFWASSIGGGVAAGPAELPVSVDFFSAHLEAAT